MIIMMMAMIHEEISFCTFVLHFLFVMNVGADICSNSNNNKKKNEETNKKKKKNKKQEVKNDNKKEKRK